MGFNLVKTATLKKLVCLNTKTCPYVSFHVPDPSGGQAWGGAATHRALKGPGSSILEW